MVFEIHPLTEIDIPALVSLRFNAYAQDVVIRTIFTPPASAAMKEHDVETAKASWGKSPNKHYACVKDSETGEMVSAVKWSVEPQQTGDDWKKFPDNFPVNPFFNRERFLKIRKDGFERQVDVMGGEPCIVLHSLNTQPHYERRGAGSMLLKHAIASTRSLNLPMYLQATPKGQGLYKRHDFVQVDSFPIDVSSLTSEPRIGLCMVRPAPRPSNPAQDVPPGPLPVIIEPAPRTPEFMNEKMKLMDLAFGASELGDICWSGATFTQKDRAEVEVTVLSRLPSDRYILHVAKDPKTGDMLGYAKWYIARDPHAAHWPNGTEAEMGPGINMALFDECFGELRRRREKIFRDKNEDYAYMGLLIVSPNAQRRGVGSALLKKGLAEVDRLGLECFIDASPEGLGLYKKFGWKEVTRVTTDLSKYGGKETVATVGLVRPKP